MAVEREVIVRRVIYVSECKKCGDRQERTKNPPKERRCNTCRTWVPYVRVEWAGPETIGL